MSYSYQETLTGESLSRYKSKLTLINCTECPYKLPAGVWENNPCKWPDLQYGDVYSYLIESPGIFTRESMKSFKSLDAHIFYLSGWVKLVQSYIPEQSNHVILRADVTPSMRVNEAPHHPWIALTKEGSVAVAHCDCMAGLSESCSHIGALLFKIEAAVKLGYTKTACTEEPYKWNADFVKKVVPATISKINFYKAARVKKAKETKRRKVKKYAKSSIDQQQQLLSALYSCSTKPVALSTFDGVSDKFFWTRPAPTIAKMPLPLNSLYSSDNQNLTIDDLYSKCKGISDRMTISDIDKTYIYDCTKTQSSSMTWYEQRIGRVSSSTIHRIYKTSLEKPSKSLLLQICNPSTTDLKVPSIVWGREHEKQAILEFKDTLSTMHQDFTVTDSGFLIDTVYPFIGVSADSIANCTCHGKSVVEVKCPYKHRDSTYEEYIADSNCCIYDKNKLDTSHPYYSQVQLQMYVHDTEFCSFVVWGKKFLIVSLVTRDNEFIHKLTTHARTFFVNCILPELLTRRLEHSSVPKKTSQTDVPLFCICQTPEDGDMIGCDNERCKYKWFHLDCIKMKQVPKSVWYCRFCKR